MSVTKVQWAGKTAEASFELDYDLCICEHVARVELPPFYVLNDDDVAWQITMEPDYTRHPTWCARNSGGRWLAFYLSFKSSSGKVKVPAVRWDVKITQSVSRDFIRDLCKKHAPYLKKDKFELNTLNCLQNMTARRDYIGAVYVCKALHNKVSLHVKLFVNEGNLPVVNAPEQPLEQAFKKSEENSLRALISSLDGLLQSGLMSDVTFIVEGQELRAHRSILAVRSDVFKAMFASECRESASGIVKIQDIRLPVFKQFLRFIYSASTAPSVKPPASKAAALVAVGEDGANAGARDQQQTAEEDDCLMELLVAADKYLVADLKEVCQGRLLDRLSGDVDGASVLTLCDVLRAGHHLASAPLRQVGIGYLRTHRAAVLATTEWKDFATDNRMVAAEAMLDSHMASEGKDPVVLHALLLRQQCFASF